MKEILLVLMEALVHQKTYSVSFNKERKNFCLSLHYNADSRYLFVHAKEMFKSKAENKKVDFPTQFRQKSIYKGFSKLSLQKYL